MLSPTQWNTELLRLAAAAALAPSSHNCQPWRLIGMCRSGFEADMQAGVVPGLPDWSHGLLVCIDRRRALSALPSLRREMYMSVGGFATLMLNLLRLSGFGVQVELVEPSWQAATASGRARLADAEPVFMMYLSEPPEGIRPVTHPLAQWVAQRRTDRGPYLPGVPAGMPVTCLPHRLVEDGGLVWRQVLPGALYDQLCGFYRRHAREDFRHGAAWRETYRYLEFSAAPQVEAGVGMNIQSLFGPLPAWKRRFYQFLLHPQVMGIVGPLGLHARIGRDFEGLLRSSAGIAFLVAEPDGQDERRSHLLAGEQVADFWLALTRDGRGLHPLSVALQHPEVEAELRSLLGVTQPILFIARVGSPAASAPAFRYRRSPQAFCSFDFMSSPEARLSC